MDTSQQSLSTPIAQLPKKKKSGHFWRNLIIGFIVLFGVFKLIGSNSSQTVASPSPSPEIIENSPSPSPSVSPSIEPSPSLEPSSSPIEKPFISAPIPTPVQAPAVIQSAPAVDQSVGATALCNDGTFSYAAHHQGACSHHGGVKQFYN